MTKTKTSGMTMKIVRCVLSTVVIMNRDDERRGHDRPGPREAEVRVEPVEDVTHHGLELADDRDGVDDHRTGSKPPWLHGLQRSSRHAASALPRMRPCRRSA